jgi:hypothetical protein
MFLEAHCLLNFLEVFYQQGGSELGADLPALASPNFKNSPAQQPDGEVSL